MRKVGLDIGSTTIKCIVLDEELNIIFRDYKRHYSHIKDNIVSTLKDLKEKEIILDCFELAISGSAGMGIANGAKISFVQEVYATRIAAKRLIKGTDCIIELGGEDAKILFLTDGLEVRMNGSCAGGTGAFIDQMATLLNVDITEMNGVAKGHHRLYSIASRCGVFAKTDIQPLLNQGASKSDIAASIFKAVVNQTIGGLAQGREISGKVAYLGGPLTFLTELQTSFNEALSIEGFCPEDSLYYVSIGAALCANVSYDITDITNIIENYIPFTNYSFNLPLFKNETELTSFRHRHALNNVKELSLDDYNKPVYLGVDSGSTTLKMVLIDEDKQIRYSQYLPNKGNPITVLKNILNDLYQKYPNVQIKGSFSTGYGEDLVRNAFNLDGGIVETMAHFTSAKKFMPEVDFIIDIGGQDIKCFKIENGIISNIFLNEACSSGCGSFLQTFANALGYSIGDFAKVGLMAPKPVDLGSRCTVFMNSSVKQAQKDGATIDNISAGLSISVVKNALYKVIRATNVTELGKHIVVQGGTFHNEAVLRAFERELNLEVVSPNISGLMGAYGAALYAMNLNLESSTIINKQQLDNFIHDVKNINCGLCSNNCSLTINTFTDGRKFISGNRCERPLAKKLTDESLNMYEYIRQKLLSYHPKEGTRGKIALPLVLNMYELYPFWYTFFTSLGFEVHNSGLSSAKTYTSGQHTVPSDTVCYPAKLVHGHIQHLINEGYTHIFYPCMSYNINEEKGDNHYNCPIVAYYPEVIINNVKTVENHTFIYDYIGIHNEKIFITKISNILKKYYSNIKISQIKKAAALAYLEYKNHLADIRCKGREIIEKANQNNLQIIVLAGRPYHFDPHINHGIDKLICSFNAAIISEEALSDLVSKEKRTILNQWTYHARLYDAARYIKDYKNMNLIQLVSFGCGLDAITTDETKTILEAEGKIYTQIKIDEITNLGAIRIRLRSLFAALNQEGEKK